MGHLVSTTTDTASGPQTTTYDYWSDGARVAQHLPDGSTTYYLGAMEATRNPDGSWGTVRRSVTLGSVAVASETAVPGQPVKTSYLLGNHQGSITTTVTDGVAASRWYEPYGKPRGPKPADQPTTTGFLNQHEDTTGLTYLNNRYLDPELGTFISVDPLVTKTMEPYVYGAANPIQFSDPSGLCTFVSGVCYFSDGVSFDLDTRALTKVDSEVGDDGFVTVTTRVFTTMLPTVVTEWTNRPPQPTPRLDKAWAECLASASLSKCGTPKLRTNGAGGQYTRNYGTGSKMSVLQSGSQISACMSHPLSRRSGINNSRLALAQMQIWAKDSRFKDFDRNAMQHAYWMALNSRDVSTDAARDFGYAHELDWRDSYLDSARDLLNNEVGIAVGADGGSNEELARKIEDLALAGSLWCVGDAGADPALISCAS